MAVVEELTPVPCPLAALRRVRHLPQPLLFESALRRPLVGQFSFLTADPNCVWETPQVRFGENPFAEPARHLEEFQTETIPGLPPFQGGVAGLLGYGLGRAWERLPVPKTDEFRLPDLLLGAYDWVLAWDHVQNRAWLIAHGLDGASSTARTDRASQRIRQIRALLENAPSAVPAKKEASLSGDQLVPQFSLGETLPEELSRLTSNFSRDAYLRTVQRGIDYIHAGDIFQTNLSQRLLFPAEGDPLDLYARLRERNPAPFAAYLAHDDWTIASASPERFVCLRDGEVETRPIKGTRHRQTGPEADLFTRDELRESVKDQAENVMIVDLLRNDLSRVCQPGSIRVPQLCGVESYETVQHLVSEIRGLMKPGLRGFDLLAALFPGGSITGAPKVRAMEIISELEPTARGPYCGSLIYDGYDGTVDSSILIRTFTIRKGWIQIPVGGGIVAQSDPEAEYQETLHKATGMLRALV